MTSEPGVVAAVFGAWSPDPFIFVGVAITALIYARGWYGLHRRMPERFHVRQLACFLGGLAVLLFAIGSPLDAFADLLLQAHMLQHWLIMMVVPPLVWLGRPQTPLLRGLPLRWSKGGLGPFLAWPALQKWARFLTHPATCWILFVVITWTWHAPALYELALESQTWHNIEHVSFLFAAMLFWWPVLQPWPSRSPWPRWAILPYLILAALANTIFSSVFTFADRVLYPSYSYAPRLFGTTALSDQSAAGAFMWVAGALVILPAVVAVAVGFLGPQQRSGVRRLRRAPPVSHGFDWLRVRFLGPALRSLALRRSLQWLSFAAALAVVVDGWFGPQDPSAANLAGVLPWTYWRGFTVVALLALGNLFCMACPFTLSQRLSQRLLGGRLRWPRALRNKWLAVVVLVIFFCANESMRLWETPTGTAWLVALYFVIAFALNGLFQGAAFCTYLCPIGQFQFMNSTISPFEVKPLDANTCSRCATHDCLRGNDQAPGCTTNLFQPTKRGNLDCTFCLDCVRACPHDNIGLTSVGRGNDLLHDDVRSSLGRLSARPDVTALALVLVFAAFATAAAMVAPVARFEAGLTARWGLESSVPIIVTLMVIAIAVLPALFEKVCTFLARQLGGVTASPREVRARFGLALLPLGFSMWLAHFGLHGFTGARSIVPAVTRGLDDLGVTSAGTPDWSMAMASATGSGALQLEILILGCGLLMSLYLAWKLAAQYATRVGPRLGLSLPWGVLAVLLYGAGVWIFLQPMAMRGTLM